MQVPMMMPQQPAPLQMVNSAAPGAPPLLVVDTSPQAMEASGFAEQGFSLPPRTTNNQTRRAPNNRGVRFQEPQQQQQQNANVKVTINKLG